MKNFTLCFIVLCAFVSMAFDSNNSSTATATTPNEAIKTDYLYTASSEILHRNISSVFSDLFDEVEKVEVHYSLEKGYYYNAYGQKDGADLVHSILVSDKMTAAQYFPTRQELGFEEEEVIVHCYWKKNDEGFKKCQEQNDRVICGTIISGEAVCSDFNIPIIIIIWG